MSHQCFACKETFTRKSNLVRHSKGRCNGKPVERVTMNEITTTTTTTIVTNRKWTINSANLKKINNSHIDCQQIFVQDKKQQEILPRETQTSTKILVDPSHADIILMQMMEKINQLAKNTEEYKETLDQMSKKIENLENKPTTLIQDYVQNNIQNNVKFEFHINTDELDPIKMFEDKLGSLQASQSYIMKTIIGANKNNVLQWFVDIWSDVMKAPVRNLGNGELLIGIKQGVYIIVNKEQIHDILGRIICKSFANIINKPITQTNKYIDNLILQTPNFITDIEQEKIDAKKDAKLKSLYDPEGLLHSNPIDYLIKHKNLRATAHHYKETISKFPEATNQEKSMKKITS